MNTRTNTEIAKDFCDAIRIFANRPENIDNLESYLSHHFPEWLKTWADTPEKIAGELYSFATMEI